ncbi:MAG TPA: RdgB/HAM1 family non-canonical purine NTP pyrophosphatase [Tepidisphaeraceae bacterium]|jgi:XTP/dITP diphosphohydrolase|nr:RdgB/HAM1 family non-canonical purine NTP pyrophosphatase [Tepidisphaeraceae bacterium]
MKLLIATGNAGKVKEFREMLGAERFEWADLSQHSNAVEVEETGRTFRANACLKAAGYAKQFKVWALADDSGLEVDALEQKPGVYSARWAEMNGAGKGDADNNSLLIQQLKDVPDEKRGARFVCVLALADAEGRIVLTARDTVEGRIIHGQRGKNGFGYDPLFLIDSLGKTTAELTPGEKHAISHRGKALRRMKELMGRMGLVG